MLRRNVFAFLVVAATVCLESGFAKTRVYRFYEGEARNPSTIAIFNTGRYGVSHVQVGDDWGALDGGVERISVDGKQKVSIDGKEKKIYLQDSWILELLPGEHAIEILPTYTYGTALPLGQSPRKVQFTAKPGHQYRILRWQTLDGISVKFWIKDETTGEKLEESDE